MADQNGIRIRQTDADRGVATIQVKGGNRHRAGSLQARGHP
jgi:hypothetical protein